jgi:hypothetical protein
MLFVSKQAIPLLLMGVALAPIDVGAQTISPANAGLERARQSLRGAQPNSPERNGSARNGRTSSELTIAISR